MPLKPIWSAVRGRERCWTSEIASERELEGKRNTLTHTHAHTHTHTHTDKEECLCVWVCIYVFYRWTLYVYVLHRCFINSVHTSVYMQYVKCYELCVCVCVCTVFSLMSHVLFLYLTALCAGVLLLARLSCWEHSRVPAQPAAPVRHSDWSTTSSSAADKVINSLWIYIAALSVSCTESIGMCDTETSEVQWHDFRSITDISNIRFQLNAE